MEPVTENELRQFAPEASSDYLSALTLGWGPEIERAEINQPARFCEFLGQFAAETGGFTIVREWTTWTPEQMCRLWPTRFKTRLDPRILACGRDARKLANLAYAGRRDLGNQGGDDGWKYRGGSFCQLTGRAAYREAGEALGLPLEARPELIERAEVGLRVAVWYWMRAGCNKFADRGYTRAIGNAINRGNAYSSYSPIGAEGRQKWRDRALAVFGDGEKIHDVGLALGAYGSEVEVLQRRLHELNFNVGRIDKVFGPATADAVAAFKLRHKRATGHELEPDEIVGPATWSALNGGEPVVYANRVDATVDDLEDSETIQGAKEGQAAGTVVTVAAGIEGARRGAESGLFDGATETLGWIPKWTAGIDPVISALGWGYKNFFWVAAIIGGVWMWRAKGKVIAARLKDHIKGWNLGR
jgi:putative chitinase